MKLWKKIVIGAGAIILIGLAQGNKQNQSFSDTHSVAPTSTISTQESIAPEVAIPSTQSSVTAPEKDSVQKEIYVPVKTYTNSSGVTVQSPTYYPEEPAGATAKCRDGTYSFSQHRSGTCSHHGGVAEWL